MLLRRAFLGLVAGAVLGIVASVYVPGLLEEPDVERPIWVTFAPNCEGGLEIDWIRWPPFERFVG